MHLPFKLFKFILCTLLLINLIFCYDPPKRFLHNSVIIDDKLLVFGGSTNITAYTYELFYLDLSTSFENNKLTWTLINEKSLPVYAWRSTAVLSLDNSTIYLYGGFMLNKNLDYDYSNLVYMYDYSTSTWSTPNLSGDTVPPRQDMKGVIDNLGKIYIFGGYNATNLTRNTGNLFNDMNLLNTASNTWTTLTISGSIPTASDQYAANILSNGIIVYFGGVEQVNAGADFTLESMNKIKLFDTNKLEWSQMDATGDDVDARMYFSSVLTPDGYIIIFGGRTYSATGTSFTSVSPKLAKLDTNKDTFEWSIPSDSDLDSPPSIYGHTANLYNDIMIITFGFNLDTRLYSSSAQVYLYNIKSDKWVTTFSPTENKSTTTTPTTSSTFKPIINTSPTKKSSKSLAIGLGVGISAADATGDDVDARMYFSSVLTPDGYIIIFGGRTYSATGTSFTSVSPKLAKLDTNKDTFEWSIPSDSDLDSPPSIYGHTANLYNDIMIITFGFNLDTRLYSSSAQVYLYNIKSDKWVTTFSPTENKSTTTTPTTSSTFKPIINTSPTKKSSKSLAIGLGVGISAAVLIACIFIVTFIVRKTKQSVRDRQPNQNEQILEIAGSNQRY
ncbi:hypothetical protein Glove_441g56 [Diversispora epigaea]|uniref:Galactose oxidase n=1 Tax=Diversispora epigaea TaxID=1348612 RepID=A0A397GV71_9GLOM|nr:hypothetical protein Glove_441g56 [Diversispora epigaea]